ncbi:small GTP-binding protein [Histomonas meleagridis]|uniref:small GTP-binding protein n=1 Tax=Histomonas meleagridis TaxID=135588 RepID=UPI003559C0B5|nr:small GTP-binding protein [Histomonas meleagridis]KAH0800217.1 small GTP-binding protein [Histomonas meleagridis]
MSKPPSSIDLKIVVLGPVSVGKTCVIHRFCNGTFLQNTQATIGAGFVPHTMHIDETEINIMLWDTAGEERFRSVAPSLLRGANGLILVYDVTNLQSFGEIEIYLNMFLDTAEFDQQQPLPVLVLGNKSDMESQVSDETIQQWAQKHNINQTAKVSAKTGDGITEAFEKYFKTFLNVTTHLDIPPISITVTKETQKEKKPCNC